MVVLFTFIEGLPEVAKLAIVGVVLRTITQLAKRSFLKGWLAKLKLKAAKTAKLATVAIFAAIAALLQKYAMQHDWSWTLGMWFAYTASAVFTHEGWQKIVVGWFGTLLSTRRE